MNMSPAIIVHGGAGAIPAEEHAAYQAGCQAAALAGFDVLRRGGSALDAIEAAIVYLEDDPAFDAGASTEIEYVERGSLQKMKPYLEGKELNELDNAILYVLARSDNPEVFEAFGHNQLLYLADKAVKAEVRMLRSSLRGVADLRVGGVSRRRKIFGLATPYRQQRAEAEHARIGR